MEGLVEKACRSNIIFNILPFKNALIIAGTIVGI